MNELSLQALVDLHDVASVICDINDGAIISMRFEGGADNE